MATTTHSASTGGARLHVQRFGTFLSNMVLPNIGAFIAWGLITALFIKSGWITLIGDKFGFSPDEHGYGFVSRLGGWTVNADTCTNQVMGSDGVMTTLADGAQACSNYGGIVGPMITYLLPLLIGYTGGKMMYKDNEVRGGVVGAIATMGAIAGAWCRCSWAPW